MGVSTALTFVRKTNMQHAAARRVVARVARCPGPVHAAQSVRVLCARILRAELQQARSSLDPVSASISSTIARMFHLKDRTFILSKGRCILWRKRQKHHVD